MLHLLRIAALCAVMLAVAGASQDARSGNCCPPSVRAPVWSPSGDAIAYHEANSAYSQIKIVDPAGNPLPWRGWRYDVEEAWPAWSPDGSMIAFWQEPGAIVVAARDGTARRIVATSVPAGRGLRPSWSPDGRRLVYVGPDTTVRVMDLRGGVERTVAAGESPVFSPDGGQIAYVGRAPARAYVLAAAGGAAVAIAATAALGRDGHITWSTDGRRLAFGRIVRNDRGAERFSIVIADVTTTRASRVIAPGADPAWSPEASRLAYVDLGLVVGQADGTATAALTDHVGADQAPSWSPDGRMIAFACPGLGGFLQLCLAELEQGVVRNLTGRCELGASTPFGYVCPETVTRSVPPQSARAPLTLHAAVSVSEAFWTARWPRCGCISIRANLHDSDNYRVRRAPVSVRTEPRGLLFVAPWASERYRETALLGNARFVLRATRRLRLAPRREVTVVLRVGPIERRLTVRLPRTRTGSP